MGSPPQVPQRVGPLDDIRVLDLSRYLSGPYATTILADLGADVVKIVKPGENAPASGELSVPMAFDWATNRDKRSLALDLGSDQGRDAFLGLVTRADVVFSNFRPGVMTDLGLDFERLQAANPRVIACDISGFGESGPWAQAPSYDLIAQAASGAIDITGPHDDPAHPPVRWGVPIGDLAAALYAVIGILAALAVRDRDGVGQQVSVSMLDGLLSLSTYRVPQVFDAGLSARTDQHMGGGGTRPYGPYRCRDGRWVAIGFAQPHWAAACEVMGVPALASDPRFSSEHLRNNNRAELEPAIEERLAQRTSSEWEALFIDAGAPAGKVNTLSEAFEHPQVLARGLIRTISDGAGRTAHVAGDPMAFSTSSRPPTPVANVADLGWADRAVGPTGRGATPLAALEPRDGSRLPFDGVHVLEMDGNEPSKTLGTQILADLGADVVLIERPVPVRPRDPKAPVGAFTLTDAMRWGMHRGKRAVTLDLKEERDRETYRALVAGTDIVYDNYRPSVKGRLGVARDDLTKIRPRIVTCSVTGFGATGPWAQAPAYDVTLQALSGSMSITGNGRPDDPPIRWGHPIGGLAGGLYGAVAVLAALRNVRRDRPPRHIDLSLLDVQIALHAYRVPQAIDLGIDFRPQPRSGGSGARPYGVYGTADDRWFAAGITDQFWVKFCAAVDRPELADDPDFSTGPARTQNAERLEEVVEAIFRSRSAEALEVLFLAQGLPGSRVLTLDEAFRHPQADRHGMLRVIATTRRPEGVHVSGFPIRFSAMRPGRWTPPPGW
jgi:crotonobetainyl-CoA:carnitine CoA-transferase CaiB-like acyl-CoA transferase